MTKPTIEDAKTHVDFMGSMSRSEFSKNRQGRRYKYRRRTLIKCYMHQNQTLVYSTLNSLHDDTSYVRNRRFISYLKWKRKEIEKPD